MTQSCTVKKGMYCSSRQGKQSQYLVAISLVETTAFFIENRTRLCKFKVIICKNLIHNDTKKETCIRLQIGIIVSYYQISVPLVAPP